SSPGVGAGRAPGADGLESGATAGPPADPVSPRSRLSPLTRKPACWIAYVAVAAAAVAVALKLFPVAIPLVNLDVRMSRAEALAGGGGVGTRAKAATGEDPVSLS